MALEACAFFLLSYVNVCFFVLFWFSCPQSLSSCICFSRYLQERLKQLHEEVNLLKSNIAKYKVAEPWRWHWRFHCTSKCHPISLSFMCQRYLSACLPSQREAHKSFHLGNWWELNPRQQNSFFESSFIAVTRTGHTETPESRHGPLTASVGPYDLRLLTWLF